MEYSIFDLLKKYHKKDMYERGFKSGYAQAIDDAIEATETKGITTIALNALQKLKRTPK